MLREKFVWFAVGIVLVCAGGASAQETSTTVEMAEVEILYVTGNTVVFKLGDEVLKREMPAGFKVNATATTFPCPSSSPARR